MKRNTITFLVLTFFITYLSWGFLILNSNLKYGEPVFMLIYVLGGFGPTISSIVIILLSDKKENRVFFKSIINYKIGYWYIPIALSVIVTPMISYVANYFMHSNGTANMQFMDWYMFFPLFIAMIIGGGLEELGWRGVLLQDIHEKYNKITTTAIVWILWTVWHLPLFFIEGVSQNGLSIIVFSINVLILTIFINWLYNKTKSIFACILFHAGWNAMLAIGFAYGKEFDISNLIELSTRGLVFLAIITISNCIKNRTA